MRSVFAVDRGAFDGGDAGIRCCGLSVPAGTTAGGGALEAAADEVPSTIGAGTLVGDNATLGREEGESGKLAGSEDAARAAPGDTGSSPPCRVMDRTSVVASNAASRPINKPPKPKAAIRRRGGRVVVGEAMDTA